jgi:iron complex transport system substrate-binding protein
MTGHGHNEGGRHDAPASFSGGLFTREQVQTAARAWTGASISLVDVRRFHLGTSGEDVIEGYHLPAPAFLFTSGGKAEVSLGSIPYFAERFGAFHAGKGTSLSVTAHSDWLEAYLLLYKASVPVTGSTAGNVRSTTTNSSTGGTASAPDIISGATIDKPPFTQSFGVIPHNPLLFVDSLRSMYADYKSTTPLGLFHAKGAFYQLVWEIYHDLEQGAGFVLHPDAIALAKRYFDEGFNHQLSIQDICENLGITTRYLRAAFGKRYGSSPQDYLTGLRIEAVKHYLMQPEIRPKEIAALTGFCDEQHLNRVFKKVEGLAPWEYRLHTVPNHLTKTSALFLKNPQSFPYNDIRGVNLIEHQKKGNWIMDRSTAKSRYGGRTAVAILAAALMLALTLLLAACGGEPATTGTDNGGQAATEQESATRIINVDGVDVEIPVDPQRVYFGQGVFVGDLLPLDPPLIGINMDVPSAYPEIWKERWGSFFESVPIVDAKDPEAVLALESDLIFISPGVDFAEDLKKIAPVIEYRSLDHTLQENLRFYGDILNRKEEAEAAIAEYEAAAEEARQRLIDAGIQDKKVVEVDIKDGQLAITGNLNFPVLYDHLGMYAPDIIEREVFVRTAADAEREIIPGTDVPGALKSVSAELLPQYLGEADIIIYAYLDERSAEEVAADVAAENPLWADLPAVKAGNVIYASPEMLSYSRSYDTHILTLDTYVDAMLELPIAKH